jgi:indole-3-glycerol phosphate synthase
MYKQMIEMLDEIVQKTKERLEISKQEKSLDELKREVNELDISLDFPFKTALSDSEISIIAEVKRASPSKGMIADDFDYVLIAKEYEDAGASAISVLTEPYFFKGSNDYLKEISQNVTIPLLRKDFIIDEYMIWEAKLLGASAVLLIVSILDIVQLKKFLDLAHDLGLSAIVEAHDGNEIRTALNVGAEIIGVNNRDLTDFSVDIENSINLRRCVSGDVIFISESGIKTPEDVRKLKENNVDAVLIGETLMKSDDKKALISELKNG